MSKKLIERLREAAAQRVASTAMIGAEDLSAAASQLESLEAAYASAVEAGKALAKQAFKAEQERDALIASLKEIAEAVAEQVDLFGRYGEVCSFEGNSMIYAETLMELGDKVASIVERHSKDAGADNEARGDQTPTTDDINLQNWKGMDGACAWHLIDRHADDWSHVARLMNAWLEANREDLVSELKALREQEPVARIDDDESFQGPCRHAMAFVPMHRGSPLYAHPVPVPVPARELTDEECANITSEFAHVRSDDMLGIARAIERHMKGEGE